VKNPFEDGRLLDKAMPYLGFAFGVFAVLQGVSVVRHGGSTWWVVAAGLWLLLAGRKAYQAIRETRGKRPS
jgi:hypothetical protein